MNFAAALLAPFLLLFSSGDVSGTQDASASASTAVRAFPDPQVDAAVPDWPIATMRSFQPEDAWQVRIERRMTIRITPRSAVPMPPEMFAALQSRSVETRYAERKMGKCLPISGIAGVQPNGDNNLILFLRDRRIVNAALDRTCHARDFYSGFYLAPSTDGMVCVDRDTLLSRSGANCKLSRIRQLVEIEE